MFEWKCRLNNGTDQIRIIPVSVPSFIFTDRITCLSLFKEKDNILIRIQIYSRWGLWFFIRLDCSCPPPLNKLSIIFYAYFRILGDYKNAKAEGNRVVPYPEHYFIKYLSSFLNGRIIPNARETYIPAIHREIVGVLEMTSSKHYKSACPLDNPASSKKKIAPSQWAIK